MRYKKIENKCHPNVHASASGTSTTTQEVLRSVRENIIIAQERQKRNYDKNQSCATCKVFTKLYVCLPIEDAYYSYTGHSNRSKGVEEKLEKR